MADLDIAEMEKFLFKLDENLINDIDYVVHMEVTDLGSWIIKFRKYGIIVNNVDIVYVDCMNVDAHISFKNNSYFWQVVNGGFEFEDELSKNNIKQSGSPDALELFRRICIKPFDPQLQQSAVNNNASVPVRSGRVISTEGQQPLKSGFLLKKRDILAGWRCRYFVVYPGKLEYYLDQHDIHSRATISLAGAEIHPAKRLSVNGVGEHWGLLVKTKNPDKTFRLASELTGMDGMVEASTWEQVFSIASKLSQEPVPPSFNTPKTSSTKRKSVTKSTTNGVTESGKPVLSSVAARGGLISSKDDDPSAKSLLVHAAVIVVLILGTYYVWRHSAVQNKGLYVGASATLTAVLIAIFIKQLSANSDNNSTPTVNSTGTNSAALSPTTSVRSSATAVAATGGVSEKIKIVDNISDSEN